MAYCMQDKHDATVREGDEVMWLPGGARAKVVQIEANFAVLYFGEALGFQTYHNNISTNIVKTGGD